MTFLLHDGELGQVRELLQQLDTPFVERIGDPADVDRRTEWDLVIANQQRITGLRVKADGRKPTRIAIVDSDSRTLRAMLRRYAIDYIVARPVHSAALRLLLLHCLYRGPEKRRRPRVSVGAPVHCRTGLLRRFSAILADLSLQGCRLICSKPLPAGTSVKISTVGPAPDGKPLSLRAKVVRSSAKMKDSSEFTVAMRLEKVTPQLEERIRKTMELYSRGPAKLERAAPPPVRTNEGVPEPSGSERRTSSRHEYSKRVVALGDEATRVLLCRDIALGGMRVE
ncbi:MAG: PilZ domain-containing protein, partial [Deltaproteobacteria bacterium]|nr:PilZ domain-containing protein [Deltaproteobacteria bacterium]